MKKGLAFTSLLLSSVLLLSGCSGKVSEIDTKIEQFNDIINSQNLFNGDFAYDIEINDLPSEKIKASFQRAGNQVYYSYYSELEGIDKIYWLAKVGDDYLVITKITIGPIVKSNYYKVDKLYFDRLVHDMTVNKGIAFINKKLNVLLSDLNNIEKECNEEKYVCNVEKEGVFKKKTNITLYSEEKEYNLLFNKEYLTNIVYKTSGDLNTKIAISYDEQKITLPNLKDGFVEINVKEEK